MNNGKESAIEEAIRGLMSGVFSRSDSKLDLTKQDNYDIVVRKSDGEIATLVECKRLVLAQCLLLRSSIARHYNSLFTII